MKKTIESQFPNKPGLLNIYFHISENSGVGYYRQYLPAIALRRNGLANVMISDFQWGEKDHIEPDLAFLTKIANWADIIVVGRKDQGQFYAQWGALKDLFNMPIVLDTDDNVQHVRPSNPGYQGYAPGSEAIAWNAYGIGKVFDALTVSTENLAKYYKKYNPKNFVLANNIDIPWWNSYEKKKFDDGFIRIGFIASAAHPEGARIIKDPIVKLLKKYPNVKFLVTHMFASMYMDPAIKNQIESIPWIKLENWPKEYKALGIDIGLAPLADNLFNRAKSNLRWLEYSVQGIPSIVSPVEAYSCVQDGVDAIVASEPDEWFEALEKLVLDKEYREKIGQNAMQRIEKEYNIDKNISKWLSVYEDIHDKYHDFFGSKRLFIIDNKGLKELGGKKRK